ncbi:hypothetical protein [Terracidiphilus sp.]|jgi:hypothetical protein|uniref:hypothetical protein n=1 Tax=Terracidiphilus sp. TaxID=1964191 RepID=UPI003C2697B3
MRSESNPASRSNSRQNPHPLTAFFEQAVRNSYEGRLGLHDPEVTEYVARLLCDFSSSDKLYELRDTFGRPVAELEQMMAAADPVHGSASSFDTERRVRKHIGDYALFVAGMYPESSRQHRRYRASFPDLVHAGKESYYIVSQFNLFEYEKEAALFGRLSDWFERCILGLTLVREELGNRRKMLPPPAVQ